MPQVRRYQPENPLESVQKLFAALKPGDLVFVGIDPGQNGAIAFMPSGRKVAPVILDIPTTASIVQSKSKGTRKKVTRTHYDYHAIALLLEPLVANRDRVTIALERGQPMRRAGMGDTGKTGFAIGMGYGMWQLYFAAMGLTWDELPPASWKPRMGLTGQGKDDSRRLACRLFPAAACYFALVSDHNRAEAAMIAEFLRRKMAGEA